MVKIKLVRVAAAAAASAGLIAGVTGAASAYTVGSHHNYKQGDKTFTTTKTVSKNNVSVSNDVDQTALTGEATTQSSNNNKDSYRHHHNNQGNSGDATSGDATNDASFTLDASVGNNGAVAGSNNYQGGGDSHGGDLTVTKTKTVSINNVDVSNNVSQTAISGDASASGGNNSGNATSGNASNSSSADISLQVSN